MYIRHVSNDFDPTVIPADNHLCSKAATVRNNLSEVVRLTFEGWSQQRIADHLGLHPTAVGILFKQAQVAGMLPAASTNRRGPGKPALSPKQWEQGKQMRREGKTQAEVGAHFGVSQNTISQYEKTDRFAEPAPAAPVREPEVYAATRDIIAQAQAKADTLRQLAEAAEAAALAATQAQAEAERAAAALAAALRA
jgi:predicted transcriptional regulator